MASFRPVVMHVTCQGLDVRDSSGFKLYQYKNSATQTSLLVRTDQEAYEAGYLPDLEADRKISAHLPYWCGPQSESSAIVVPR